MKKRSFLEECDPRLKIILAFAFALSVALTQSWWTLLGALGLSIFLAIMARLDLKRALKKLLPANLFLLFIALTLPFTTPGKTVLVLGPLKASQDGLWLAIFILFKSNLILWASLCLLGTSSIFSLAHALHHLHVPNKLVQLLFFTFRYLELLKREYRRLWEAALLRGFIPRTNLHTYRTMAYLIGSLLVRSYDRAGRVYEAMLCRGFSGTFPVYRHFSCKRKDLLFGSLSLLYIFLVALLGYFD